MPSTVLRTHGMPFQVHSLRHSTDQAGHPDSHGRSDTFGSNCVYNRCCFSHNVHIAELQCFLSTSCATSCAMQVHVVSNGCSTPAVKVSPQLKGADHAPAVGHVGQQAQLQLAIVSDNQRLAGLCTEGLAHLGGTAKVKILSVSYCPSKEGPYVTATSCSQARRARRSAEHKNLPAKQ
jgi:hypothetical protein